ncbi:MAG TPA: L-histidine N(alpha)-methyltransferase [Pyrinomonadaceae bacterium]|nr:L-histidine N(alpha)-methyltransferase [Pyrinomonadaceae bacterium]
MVEKTKPASDKRREKPRIFLAYASEAEDLANELGVLMGKSRWAHIIPWYYVSEPGMTILQTLESMSDVQFAVVLYTGEDKTESRGVVSDAPRDNVVFELAFFIAKLGVERVVLVCPEDAPKIPSDYTGYGVLKFDPSDGTPKDFMAPVALELTNRFKQFLPMKEKREQPSAQTPASPSAVTSDETVKPVDIVYKPSSAGIIPIYRDLNSSLDWFVELETNINSPYRYLNSKLLYYGPGLAKFWIQRSRWDAANRDMIGLLDENLRELLDPYRADSINVIDLGVGDFDKGHKVLEFFLKSPEVRTINYFPFDVSYEMLGLALRTRTDHFAATTLQAVQQNGSITAINATFSQLEHYRHLLTPPSSNIFLLLGNTLGNESVESQTLGYVAAGMNPGDLLLTEVQLIEKPVSTTIEEDNVAIQRHKEFFTGPFWALGYDRRNIDLSIRTNEALDKARGIPAVTYEVICRLKKPLRVRHPAFANDKISVPAGEDICVYLIRLYHEEALVPLLTQAGFEVLQSRVTPARTPPRRFHYVVARKLG